MRIGGKGKQVHNRTQKIMPDDKSNTGKPDDIRINVNQPYELRDWSQELGVTAERLKQVVQQVGPMVKDVKRVLGVS
jgi:hypothetical protein